MRSSRDSGLRGRRSGGGAAGHGSFLGLKTLAAEHGPALCWFEWDGGFGAALRAVGAGLGSRSLVSAAGILAGALGLAGLAALGIVFKLPVLEK